MNIKPVRTKTDHRVALKMIWRLRKGLAIPAECLIKPPQERRAA